MGSPLCFFGVWQEEKCGKKNLVRALFPSHCYKNEDSNRKNLISLEKPWGRLLTYQKKKKNLEIWLRSRSNAPWEQLYSMLGRRCLGRGLGYTDTCQCMTCRAPEVTTCLDRTKRCWEKSWTNSLLQKEETITNINIGNQAWWQQPQNKWHLRL